MINNGFIIMELYVFAGNKSNHTGMIVAIVIPSVVAIAASMAMCLFCWRRRTKSKRSRSCKFPPNIWHYYCLFKNFKKKLLIFVLSANRFNELVARFFICELKKALLTIVRKDYKHRLRSKVKDAPNHLRQPQIMNECTIQLNELIYERH